MDQHKRHEIKAWWGNHVRAQVPVDVAVEEPRAGVVGIEPDRDIVARAADAHDVADDGVHKVV